MGGSINSSKSHSLEVRAGNRFDDTSVTGGLTPGISHRQLSLSCKDIDCMERVNSLKIVVKFVRCSLSAQNIPNFLISMKTPLLTNFFELYEYAGKVIVEL